MASSQDRQEANRRQVAGALSTYLQMKSRLEQAQIQKYTDRICSGQHDDFLHQISIALQDQAQDLFAEADDSQSVGRGRHFEILTFLAMQDEGDRFDSVAARKGQQRGKKDRQQLVTDFERRIATSDAHLFVTLSDEPYPPCVASLNDLQTIKLSQLTGETLHRGCKLLVRRVGVLDSNPVVTKTVVVDEDGDAENVEIYHAASDIELTMPADALFAIKEPCFYTRSSGTSAIRVDHPNNILLPRDLQGLSPESSNQSITKTAQEWKDTGNELLTKNQIFEAGEAYKAALEVGAQGKLELDLHRNLARVDLSLARYEKARTNAISAVSDGKHPALVSLDGKAYYRAGCACYHLRDFAKAEEYFQKLLSLCPSDDEGRRELTRVQQRLAEQQNGRYEFGSVVQKLSRKQPRVDMADFKRLTRIGESKGRGRGLFAAEDIQLGDLTLCDKAFSATMEWEHEANSVKAYDPRRKVFDGFPAALWSKTVQQLSKAPSRLADVTNLCGHYSDQPDSSRQAMTAEPSLILDAFQIHEILTENAFALPTPSKTQRTQAFGVMKTYVAAAHLAKNTPDNCALYSHASLVNHSCLPNATRVFIGDAMAIRATRHIAKGEEILHTYATYSDFREKQSRMHAIWHFQCDCQLCMAESKETDDARKRRATLIEEADKLGREIITNLPKSQQWREGSRRAEKLCSDIKATYTTGIYEGLPLSGMSYIQTALAHVYLLRQEYNKCKAVIIDAFDCLGWTLTLQKDAGVAAGSLQSKVRFASRLTEDMVTLLAIAYRMILATKRDKKLANPIRDLAERIYLTLNGVMYGIETIDVDLGKSIRQGKE